MIEQVESVQYFAVHSLPAALRGRCAFLLIFSVRVVLLCGDAYASIAFFLTIRNCFYRACAYTPDQGVYP